MIQEHNMRKVTISPDMTKMYPRMHCTSSKDLNCWNRPMMVRWKYQSPWSESWKTKWKKKDTYGSQNKLYILYNKCYWLTPRCIFSTSNVTDYDTVVHILYNKCYWLWDCGKYSLNQMLDLHAHTPACICVCAHAHICAYTHTISMKCRYLFFHPKFPKKKGW